MSEGIYGFDKNVAKGIKDAFHSGDGPGDGVPPKSPEWSPKNRKAYLVWIDAPVPARTGDEPGELLYSSGNVTFRHLDKTQSPPVLVDMPNTEFDIYNWVTVATGSARYVFVVQDTAGVFWVVSEECP